MAFNARRKQRREECKALRAEGAEAFRAGQHIQTVPKSYLRTENRHQWERGWREAEWAARDGGGG